MLNCPVNYSCRRQKAHDILLSGGFDALIFTKPENIFYLCGFSGSDGALILTSDSLVFLTDSRYTTQAEIEVTADSIDEYKTKSDGIISTLEHWELSRIGFEASLAVSLFEELQNKANQNWQWQSLQEEIQTLRLHKADDEIHAMTLAADLNQKGFDEIKGLIKPGAREKDISLALEFAMRRQGAEEKAFDIIVASGVRGAMPHGIASDKQLAEGELITIDFGCRYKNYHSDETITFAMGEVSKDLRHIFDIVLEAHDRALEAVSPGVPLSELDAIARGYIASCGYSDYFGHGLGHGIGLDVHESPVVSQRSKLIAEEGMVFTVEPGIYIPETGGVRIEDMVLVTSEGHRVLTKISKKFHNILLN